MKALGKLKINPEKLINIKDLVLLSGGYDYMCCLCYATYLDPAGYMAGAGSTEDCNFLCREAGWDHGVYSPGGTGSC